MRYSRILNIRRRNNADWIENVGEIFLVSIQSRNLRNVKLRVLISILARLTFFARCYTEVFRKKIVEYWKVFDLVFYAVWESSLLSILRGIGEYFTGHCKVFYLVFYRLLKSIYRVLETRKYSFGILLSNWQRSKYIFY